MMMRLGWIIAFVSGTACAQVPVSAPVEVFHADDPAFGVIPDDGLDDSAALQAALDAAALFGVPLHLPQGQIDLFDTVSVSKAQGLEIVGRGPLTSGAGWVNKGAYTHIVVHSTEMNPDPVGIEIIDSSSCKLSQFSVEGPGGTAGSRSGTGVKFSSNSGGWASWNAEFENIHFRFFGVGLLIGGGTSDTNCSECVLRRVQFTRCDVGFETIGDQAVNHLFEQCGFGYCEVGLDLDAASLMLLQPHTYATGTFIRVKQQGAGTNAGNIEVASGRFDGDHVRRMTWLDSSASIGGLVAEFRMCYSVPGTEETDPRIVTGQSFHKVSLWLCRRLGTVRDPSDPGVVLVDGEPYP